MNIQGWTGSLKPGDRVFVAHHYGGAIGRVTKLTATQVVVDHANMVSRFYRDSARRIGAGGSFYSTRIEPLTPEREAQVLRRQMLDLVKGTKWDEVNDRDLGRIVKILKEPSA